MAYQLLERPCSGEFSNSKQTACPICQSSYNCTIGTMSSEYERIEQLSDKLGHSIVDIRRRAAQNLLSKVQNGIIPVKLLSATHCVDVLATGISACIDLSCNEIRINHNDESYQELLLNVLKLICHIGNSDASSTLASEKYAMVLDGLYRLADIKTDEITDMKATIEEVHLTSLHSNPNDNQSPTPSLHHNLISLPVVFTVTEYHCYHQCPTSPSHRLYANFCTQK